MTTIRTKVRVGPDGNVVVPVGIAESGRTVEVVVAPADDTGQTINGILAAEWWERFDRLAGSIDDPTFERPPQEPFEPRSWD